MAHVYRPGVNLGEFCEKDFSNWFTYRASTVYPDLINPTEWPHLIDVGNGEDRYARVLKTVAYVVVDEDLEGLVVQKWNIKKHNIYPEARNG